MDKIYQNWKKNYDIAKEYYKKYGTINVGRSVVYKNLRLGQWVATQKSVHNGTRKGRLTNRQVSMLEGLEIVWWNSDNVAKKINTHAKSKEYMAAAKKYFEQHGDLLIPSNYVDNGLEVGRWIINLRKHYHSVPIDVLENNPQETNKYIKNSRLSIENIIALNDMGMLWKEVSTRNWNYKYELAKAYYQEYGDLHIPSNYIAKDENKSHLGEWIRYNRQLYSNGRLSKERITKLNGIGMIWDVYETLWDEKYLIAKAYYKEFGNLKVSQNLNYHECNLGAWIDWQRQARKGNVRNALSDRRIKLLDEIDMIWNVPEVS